MFLSQAKKNFSSLGTTTSLFIILTFIALFANILKLKGRMNEISESRKKTPYIFLGVKFTGLNDILGSTERIGYYTDKNMDNNLDARQFAQAQYVLAPIVLDLNNTNYEYILFDCSTPQVAWQKIIELRVIPLRKNSFGIILAKNPAAKPVPGKQQMQRGFPLNSGGTR